jgi:hypothetical protein
MAARANTSTGSRCTVRSIYLPSPDGLRKVSAEDQRIFAVHPVTGRRVIIRSWKDLRDLEKAAVKAGVPWDKLVVVTPRGTNADVVEIAAALNDTIPAGWSRVVLDSETARGRVYLPWLGNTAGPSSSPVHDVLRATRRAELLTWLEGALNEPEQKSLRRLGAAQLTAQLFGDKTRKDLIRNTGDALLPRGPTGRFPDRREVVALAAIVSDHLSADRIADVLTWPYAPWIGKPAAASEAFAAVLDPLDDTARWQLVEAFALTFGSPRGTDENRAGRAMGGEDFDWDDDYPYDEDGYDARYDARYDYRQQKLGPDPLDFVEAYTEALNAEIGRFGGGLEYTRVGLRVPGRRYAPSLETDPLRALRSAAQLTEYACRAGFTLPQSRRDWREYLRTLEEAVAPPALCWQHRPETASLDGQPVPGWSGARLVLPGHERVLRDWGTQMGNCVGSYDSSIEQGERILFGIVVDGTVVANAELCWYYGWEIGQVYGKFNRLLEPSEAEAVRAVLQPLAETLSAPEPITLDVNPAARAHLARIDTFSTGNFSVSADDAPSWNEDPPSRHGGKAPKTRAPRPVGTATPLERRQAAATFAAALVDVAGVVDHSLAAEVARDSDPERLEQARGMLAALARHVAPPDLAFVTELAAAVEPAHAWMNPRTATRARQTLEALNETADPSGLAEALTELELFPAAPETTGMIARAVELWANGRLGEEIATRAWAANAQVLLPLANGDVIPMRLDDEPSRLPYAMQARAVRAGGVRTVREALDRLRRAAQLTERR